MAIRRGDCALYSVYISEGKNCLSIFFLNRLQLTCSKTYGINLFPLLTNVNFSLLELFYRRRRFSSRFLRIFFLELTFYENPMFSRNASTHLQHWRSRPELSLSEGNGLNWRNKENVIMKNAKWWFQNVTIRRHPTTYIYSTRRLTEVFLYLLANYRFFFRVAAVRYSNSQ